MCRNIKTLFNFAPPATGDEIKASALQYVRKISGIAKPSAANQVAFDEAISKVELITQELLNTLITSSPPKNREKEAEKAKLRNQKRFGRL